MRTNTVWSVGLVFFVLLSASRSFAVPEATNPRPADGKSGVAVDVVQSWTPGDSVADYAPGQYGNGHHIIFHPTKSWVEAGTLSYSLGFAYGHFRADSNSWSFSDPVFGAGLDLSQGHTYYWKIIEVNDTNGASPWESSVWSITTIGPKASNPYPPDGSVGADVNVTLTWTAGTKVACSPNGGHDVFFGTNQTDVETATVAIPKGVYQGRRDPNSFSPGPLVLGPTYYWRIDEVNDSSGTVTGDVWSFATTGTGASVPNPADGAIVGELVNPTVDVNLSWLAGTYADDTNGHDVYFGTNFSEVNNLTPAEPDPNGIYKGRQSPGTYRVTSLPLDVTYYWRIDEISTTHPDSPWKGPVWSFTTNSGIAFGPEPADGEKRVSIEQTLSWTAGFGAVSHDVYFGTVSPPAFVKNQTANTYKPSRMQRKTTYYWRIDEHNSQGTKQGSIRSFETSGYDPAYPGKVGINTGPQFVDWARQLSSYSKADGGTLTASDLDANGWPEVDFQMFFDLRLVAEWENPPHTDDPEQYRIDRSGTYKCSFTGQGSVYIVWGTASVQNVSYDAGTNTTTFELVLPAPGPGQLFLLRFEDTKRTPASPYGSGVTNLKIIRPGYPADTTQTFTDEFLNAFTSVDWACWRNATSATHPYPDEQQWSERKRADDCPAIWNLSDGKLESLPWENVIELSNLTGISPWISIPVSATDDYITQAARMLKEKLDASIDIYVELSNEVWNTGTGFPGVWNADEAAVLGIQPNRNYARRVINMALRFQDVFGPDSLNNRIKVVLAGHHVCLDGCIPNNMVDMLNYIQSTYGPPKMWIYALATTNYFRADPVIETGTVDELLRACRDNIDSDLSLRQQWVDTAATWQLPGGCVTYEAGYHTPCCGVLTNLDNQFTMHRVPRAFDVLKYNHDEGWLALGGSMTNHFVLYGSWSRWGAWGATDDVSIPDRNYKLQAVRQLAGNLTADFNNDKVVDFRDFCLMAAQWAGPGETDLNGDGIVDEQDVLKVALDWLWIEQ